MGLALQLNQALASTLVPRLVFRVHLDASSVNLVVVLEGLVGDVSLNLEAADLALG